MLPPHAMQITYGVDPQRIKMAYAIYDAWGRHRHPTTWNYTVQNPFGMGGSNDITLRGYTFHAQSRPFGKHLHHFSLINMNGRLYDYVLGRMLSPDNYVQSPNSSQSFNRYSYCWNNPLKYTDPSGEIVWMVPIVAAAVFGTGNLLVQASNGEINSWGDGFKAFGSGALAGAAIGTGVSFGLGVPILGTALKFAGWAYAGTTTISAISGLGHGISTGDWRRLENSAKIFAGNFYLDENKSFFGAVWEGISRYSYQFIQTNIGYNTAQFSNIVGEVTNVNFWGGATFSHTNYEGGSITFGNNILLSNLDPETKMIAGPGGYTTMHEYGHYLQSQRSGFSYLFKYGIPSGFKDAEWTELDANLGASKYFKKHYDFDWDTDYYTGSQAKYSNLPNGKLKNTRWWEWPIFPFTFFWN